MDSSSSSSSRPRRAAAANASEKISSQYSSLFVEQAPETLPSGRSVARSRPRPRPSPRQGHADKAALVIEEDDEDSVPETPSQPAPPATPVRRRLRARNVNIAAPPPTPSSLVPLKRRRAQDLGNVFDGAGASVLAGPSAPPPATPDTSKPKRAQRRSQAKLKANPTEAPPPSPSRIRHQSHEGDSAQAHVPGPYERKVLEGMQAVKVIKHVSAPEVVSAASIFDDVQDPFAFIYNDNMFPVHPDRSYEAEVITSPKHDSKWRLGAKHGAAVRIFLVVDKEHYTEIEAWLICHKLADALNRWPNVDDISKEVNKLGGPRSQLQLLFAAAQYSACPHLPLRGTHPCLIDINGNHGDARIQVRLSRIDPVTLQGIPETLTMTDSGEEVPEVSNILFRYVGGTVYEGPQADNTWRSCIPSDYQPKFSDQIRELKRAKGFLRFVHHVWARRSPLRSKEDAKSFFDNMKQIFNTDRQRWRRLYNEGALCQPRQSRVGTYLFPTAPVRKNISGKLPSLVIQSWDNSWTESVFKAGELTWLESSDPIAAWVSMSRAVDIVNLRICAGDESPASCHCSPDDSTETMHPCTHCCSMTTCSALALGAWGLPECANCLVLTGYQRSSVNVTQRLAEESLMHSLIAECKSNGLPLQSSAIRDARREGEERIRELLPHDLTSGWTNLFSGKVMSPQPHAKHLLPSVDAVFPFGIQSSGQTLLHAANNLALIPAALNSAKHIQLPIAVQKIAQYFRRFTQLKGALRLGEEPAVQEIEALQGQLVTDCTRFSQIRMKAGWTRAKRSGKSMSQEQFEYHKEEWISGKLHPGSPTQPSRQYTWFEASHGWPTAERGCIDRIVGEIEAWTGVDLPRRHGCPFFGHPTTMPLDWDWHLAYRLMYNVLAKMRRHCNKFWLTEDTIITVFLECIFQVCVRKMFINDDDKNVDKKKRLQDKYAEFLGLPLHIDIHNPLTFAVAHRVHGYQMLTGWPTTSLPQGLSDRKDERNNILIETRTSNYLKLGYDERWYPDLKALILEVEIPVELANEELIPSPLNPQFESNEGVIYSECCSLILARHCRPGRLNLWKNRCLPSGTDDEDSDDHSNDSQPWTDRTEWEWCHLNTSTGLSPEQKAYIWGSEGAGLGVGQWLDEQLTSEGTEDDWVKTIRNAQKGVISNGKLDQLDCTRLGADCDYTDLPRCGRKLKLTKSYNLKDEWVAKDRGHIYWLFRAVSYLNTFLSAVNGKMTEATLKESLNIDNILDKFGKEEEDSTAMDLFTWGLSAASSASSANVAVSGFFNALSSISTLAQTLAPTDETNDRIVASGALRLIYDAASTGVKALLSMATSGYYKSPEAAEVEISLTASDIPFLQEDVYKNPVAQFFQDGVWLLDNDKLGKNLDRWNDYFQLRVRQAIVMALLRTQNWFVYIDSEIVTEEDCARTGSGNDGRRFINGWCFDLWIFLGEPGDFGIIEDTASNPAYSKAKGKYEAMQDTVDEKNGTASYGAVDLTTLYKNALDCALKYPDGDGAPDAGTLDTSENYPVCFFYYPVIRGIRTNAESGGWYFEPPADEPYINTSDRDQIPWGPDDD
ncbi:hypothetical protein B0J13DRAFT_610892 [Dactylonectria estremocensis]|uniref:Uncharacterized protein n=1 Tax=Dactylonectria estremocensis TaxID=1079267 RepID=A0A9P9E066_9HYPO|nr:hypothetical protein B0J13DRAFT_610892 [Dactylonectria estremocensis]